MTSGLNWRHLNKPQTEDARRSIRRVYHGVTAKLQHFRAEVAQAAGVSVQTLQGWTEGEGEPTMEQADLILEFLRHKD